MFKADTDSPRLLQTAMLWAPGVQVTMTSLTYANVGLEA